VVVRRGRLGPLCDRGADPAHPRGPSTSPLDSGPASFLLTASLGVNCVLEAL
jgi:hypothetical protein